MCLYDVSKWTTFDLMLYSTGLKDRRGQEGLFDQCSIQTSKDYLLRVALILMHILKYIAYVPVQLPNQHCGN